jgi:cytochrome c2
VGGLRALGVGLLLLGGAAAGSEEDRGFRLYQQHCRTCHVLKAGDHRLGPSLLGVVGRQAGTVPGYGFSRSMAGSNVVWDPATLDAFLADPAGFMPGNGMIYSGMASAEDRLAVIAYMAGVE